jgi:hypothetical protein
METRWLQNQTIFMVLFAAAPWLAARRGYSFVELLNQKLDRVFVEPLRKWQHQLGTRTGRTASTRKT